MTYAVPLHILSGPSASGEDYLQELIPNMLEKALGYWMKRPHRHPQPKSPENAWATAAIVVTAISMESYTYMLYWYEQANTYTQRTPQLDFPKDLSSMLISYNPNLPGIYMEALLDEVYAVRNAIVHSHIYDAFFYLGSDTPLRLASATAAFGNQKTRRWNNSVNKATRRTRKLHLNYRPTMIGCGDLFKVLMLFDLILAVSDNAFNGSYSLPSINVRFGAFAPSRLSQLLACCYDQIPSEHCIGRVDHLSATLRRRFADYPPPGGSRDCFITDQCPKCGKLGFTKQQYPHACSRCGHQS